MSLNYITECCILYLNEPWKVFFIRKVLTFRNPLVIDDKGITFLPSRVNGLIGDQATHFFLSSHMDGAAHILDDKIKSVAWLVM